MLWTEMFPVATASNKTTQRMTHTAQAWLLYCPAAAVVAAAAFSLYLTMREHTLRCHQSNMQFIVQQLAREGPCFLRQLLLTCNCG
jgi:Na+/proline symporter